MAPQRLKNSFMHYFGSNQPLISTYLVSLKSTMLSPIKFDKVTPRGILTMKFDDFYQQLMDQLNQATAGSNEISQEAKIYLRAATSNLFNKLDIVSKEEFEAQKAVLARSREKINQLELQLEQLKQLIESAK